MIKKFGRLLSAAILLVPATIFAIPAKASPDGDFLGALHSRGIEARGGDDVLVDLAHQICMIRSRGVSEQAVIDMLLPYAHAGLGPSDITFIVQQAEAAYCPNTGGVLI